MFYKRSVYAIFGFCLVTQLCAQQQEQQKFESQPPPDDASGNKNTLGNGVIIEKITTGVNDALKTVSKFGEDVVNKTEEKIGDIKNGLGNFVNDAKNTLNDAKNTLNDAKNTLNESKNNIASAFNNEEQPMIKTPGAPLESNPSLYENRASVYPPVNTVAPSNGTEKSWWSKIADKVKSIFSKGD